MASFASQKLAFNWSKRNRVNNNSSKKIKDTEQKSTCIGSIPTCNFIIRTKRNVTTWDAAAATAVVNAWVVVKYSPEQRLFFEMWQDALTHIEIDKDRIDSYASRLARADIGHDELSNSKSIFYQYET